MDIQISESAPYKALFVSFLSFFVPLIPIVYFIVIKKIDKFSVIMMLIGAFIFVLFALVLERLLHLLVFYLFPQLKNTIWSLCAYGAFMAGLFEETGRLLAFIFLKNNEKYNNNNLNSIFYGIGHGGIEVYLLVTLQYFVNFIYCKKAINKTLDQKQLDTIYNQLILLSNSSYSFMLYVVYERIVALNYHICASVIVWIGVMKNKIYLYFIAILLHFSLDFSIGVSLEFKYYSKIKSLIYIIFSDWTILTLIIAIILWIKYIDNESKKLNANESITFNIHGNDI